MSGAFVGTLKKDYAYMNGCFDADTVLKMLPGRSISQCLSQLPLSFLSASTGRSIGSHSRFQNWTTYSLPLTRKQHFSLFPFKKYPQKVSYTGIYILSYNVSSLNARTKKPKKTSPQNTNKHLHDTEVPTSASLWFEYSWSFSCFLTTQPTIIVQYCPQSVCMNDDREAVT